MSQQKECYGIVVPETGISRVHVSLAQSLRSGQQGAVIGTRDRLYDNTDITHLVAMDDALLDMPYRFRGHACVLDTGALARMAYQGAIYAMAQGGNGKYAFGWGNRKYPGASTNGALHIDMSGIRIIGFYSDGINKGPEHGVKEAKRVVTNELDNADEEDTNPHKLASLNGYMGSLSAVVGFVTDEFRENAIGEVRSQTTQARGITLIYEGTEIPPVLKQVMHELSVKVRDCNVALAQVPAISGNPMQYTMELKDRYATYLDQIASSSIIVSTTGWHLSDVLRYCQVADKQTDLPRLMLIRDDSLQGQMAAHALNQREKGFPIYDPDKLGDIVGKVPLLISDMRIGIPHGNTRRLAAQIHFEDIAKLVASANTPEPVLAR